MYDYKTHFRSTYDNFKSKFKFQGNSINSLREWQREFRPEIERAIGLKNIESDLKTHVPTTTKNESEDMQNYVREKWTLLVEPTVPLPL